MTEEYQRKPPPSRDERGILWNKGKWTVTLVRQGKRHYLGRYLTKARAIAVRDAFLKESPDKNSSQKRK